MNFEIELKENVSRIQSTLKEYLPKEEGFQVTVLRAMNYSMLAGGKRLRPLLMQQTYRLFGGEGKVIEPFMAAIEMIHTHSLIHDDLPAIDNDEYRRGRKTTHAVYGEAMAILAGDGLLNLAYETAAKAFEMEPENQKIGRAIAILASKTGIYGMIGGQTVDVEEAGKLLDRERLNFIYRLKTGALIEASMMIGALLAGACEQEITCVEQIASGIGLAFQIRDDILDVTGSQQELGKPINSDERNQKTTYVTIEGIEKAAGDVEEISRQAIEGLHSLKYENPFLEELIIRLINRNK